MKNIASDIFRQRLLIEGYCNIDVTRAVVDDYLRSVARHLGLRTYADPIIYSPTSGAGKAENQGYDAFVPLIDSGISLYIWTQIRFFSIVLYSCKEFDVQAALAFTRDFFKVSTEIEYMSF
ncbi:MAG: hypothetical protein JSU65_14080 [Candidatus Zixiibacteriota bacterium]|nr:MAG: hypothetical protein JSU65_14080 [candidate division Zixibacteria bacterium]